MAARVIAERETLHTLLNLIIRARALHMEKQKDFPQPIELFFHPLIEFDLPFPRVYIYKCNVTRESLKVQKTKRPAAIKPSR